jgi:hypothetical protein
VTQVGRSLNASYGDQTIEAGKDFPDKDGAEFLLDRGINDTHSVFSHKIFLKNY